MNKEEILKKVQTENKDEMELQIRDKSIKWTYLALVISAAVFSFIRGEKGQPTMDLCATVGISVCVGQVYRYIKTKDKSCLLIASITLVVSIFAIIRYIGGH